MSVMTPQRSTTKTGNNSPSTPGACANAMARATCPNSGASASLSPIRAPTSQKPEGPDRPGRHVRNRDHSRDDKRPDAPRPQNSRTAQYPRPREGCPSRPRRRRSPPPRELPPLRPAGCCRRARDFAVQRRVQPQGADHPANQAVAHGRRYPSARSFWRSVCHAIACAAIPP